MKEEKKKLIKSAARTIPQQQQQQPSVAATAPPPSASAVASTGDDGSKKTNAATAAQQQHAKVVAHGSGALLRIVPHDDGEECDDSCADVSAHRSCPNLALSSPVHEQHCTVCVSDRGRLDTGSSIQFPLSVGSANTLLPTPKSCQQFLLSDIGRRTSKSMDNIRGEAEKSATMIQISKLLMCKEKSELTNEEFFDLIERLNGNRMPDQRAEFPKQGEEEEGDADEAHRVGGGDNMTTDSLMQLIAEFQSRRYDDQRASPVPSGHGKKAKKLLRRLSLKAPKSDASANPATAAAENNEQLYELIMSYQAARLEDQRSELGGRKELMDDEGGNKLMSRNKK